MTPSPAPSDSEAHDELVDAGGYRLHILYQGAGYPVVVFDAGFGDTLDIWDQVAPVIARETRVCLYERAGVGRSERHQRQLTTSAQIVADLRTALHAAELAPPYVLVGHSFGGLNMRLYAHLYPGEVAGLVLLDPADGDVYAALAMTSDSEADGITIDLAASGAQAQAITSLGAVPLIVVTQSFRDLSLEHAELAELAALWRSRQEAIARLSSNGRWIVDGESGHYIHRDQPDIVIAAIRDVIRMVREATTLPSR